MNAKKDIQQQTFQENPWNVYLSGEIHSDWREQIKEVLNTYQVPIQFSEPNTGHSDSDDCGSILLGSESDSFWHCLLYTSPSPRDKRQSRMPSSA